MHFFFLIIRFVLTHLLFGVWIASVGVIIADASKGGVEFAWIVTAAVSFGLWAVLRLLVWVEIGA